MTAYEPDNIFAKILRGEMPCHKIYEDDDNFAFMDIMPRGPGHCLVIPKAPVRNILDAGDDVLARLYPATTLMVAAMIAAPNRYESRAWHSTTRRTTRLVMSVSAT